MPQREPKELVWVSILVSLSLLMLVGLLCWPATGWMVRLQLVSQILPAVDENREAAQSRVAAANPHDYQIQLARTLTASYSATGLANSAVRVQHLHELAVRFSNEPSVYAHALRFATQDLVLLQRTEQNELSADLPVKSKDTVQPTKPEDLAAFEQDAANGERLDPDNAFFALMHAVAYYEAGRDAEAVAAIHRAGQMTRYEDYASSEFGCIDKFFTLAHGQRGVVGRTASAASISFPQYASIRALARMGVVSAVHAELKGNAEEGFAIRRDLMQCGALMRVQGHSLICNLVGIAVVPMAMARPGGKPATKAPGNYAKLTEPQRMQYQREKREVCYSYLGRIGHGDEARWAEAEINAGVQAKATCKKIVEVGPFNMNVLTQISLWWLINLLTLTNAIGLLILGATAALAAAITPKTHLKLWRGLFGLAVACVFGLWLFNVERGAANWASVPLQMAQAGTTQSGEGSEGHGAEILMQVGGLCLALALPLLLLLVIGILSIKMKVSLPTGLGRGLRGLSLPLACLLFMLYSVLVIGTVHSEAQMNTALENINANEGANIAPLLGQKWPGAVPR